MNLVVTHGAGLILRRLIVCRPGWPGGRQLGREGVALQAQHVHHADSQKPRIRGTVRRMATAAAFGLHRYMLVDERPLLIDVALVTNRISAGLRAHLPHVRCAMGIVAVVALHQALVYAVMVGLGKIRFGRSVAAIAQVRLALRQQTLFFLRVVRRVAIEAADLAAGVRGLRKMRLLVTIPVAGEAAGASLLPRMFFEHIDLRLIAAARYVIGPWAVTAFAALLGGSTRFVERGLPVRRFFPGVIDFFVAGFAGFRAHILGSIWRCVRWRCAAGLSALPGNRLASLSRGKDDADHAKEEREQKSLEGPGVCRHSHEIPRDLRLVMGVWPRDSMAHRFVARLPLIPTAVVENHLVHKPLPLRLASTSHMRVFIIETLA